MHPVTTYFHTIVTSNGFLAEVRESSTSARFHFSNSHTEINMEEERLIPPQERKPRSRPRSSPSSRDTNLVVVRRPATARFSRVSDASDLRSTRGQDGGASLQTRDELQNEKEEETHESGEKQEAFIHNDSVGITKVDEGWIEGYTARAFGDDNPGMADPEFSSSFTQVNEQIPYESPPKYCKR